MPAEEQETELLKAAQSGDHGAFERVVSPHLATVERLAGSLSRTPEDANDIFQEVLIRAARSIDTFRADSSLRTWLCRLTRNAAIDWYRVRKSRQHDELADDDLLNDERAAAPEALAESKDQIELMYLALRQLPPTFRVPLVLAELEGMSHDDVAAIEKVPKGTIKSRVSRGKQQLKEILGTLATLEEVRSNPRLLQELLNRQRSSGKVGA